MTAANIARALGIKNIRVNYLISEILFDTIFEKCPMKELIIRKFDKEHIVKNYLEGIEFEEKVYH
jgi:hypothetical protein